MANLTERVAFGTAGALGGFIGIVASSGACGGSGCVSCYGCAGMGLLLATMTLVKRAKGVRHGRNTCYERNAAINESPSG